MVINGKKGKINIKQRSKIKNIIRPFSGNEEGKVGLFTGFPLFSIYF